MICCWHGHGKTFFHTTLNTRDDGKYIAKDQLADRILLSENNINFDDENVKFANSANTLSVVAEQKNCNTRRMTDRHI